MLLDDSLRGLELVRREAGPVVDVGSGGGAPGIPLALALPEREFVLLEAQERKCAFLREHAPPNARVVWGRAEEQAVDWAGCALAKALAPPPVAAEWCLPLVRPGGAVVLWVGPTAEPERRARGRREARGRGRAGAGRVRRAAQDRADARGLSAPAGYGEEASARVARFSPCPARSTRLRTRRAASARRRRPSTSPPASRRPARGRSSSTSTPRRTRRPASACAPTARRRTTSWTARASPRS